MKNNLLWEVSKSLHEGIKVNKPYIHLRDGTRKLIKLTVK
jgi:uncharacterized protein (UPF0216 family)